ncbi:hypothetical protein [Devosia elaeis]|uniref:Uncharacterized protein n=1 Tax=Devosia elaeis TaxID=1770058 RepID=A0A178I5I3_9HYPH|nr:hypothetical protein [Devosia elaeis]OAM84202.1 hypothetical protein A3840_00020 [Devosia elaeis]
MTLPDMDKDLSAYTDFQKLSDRVVYWERRFALTNPDAEDEVRFKEIAAKHSTRVLSVMRAG